MTKYLFEANYVGEGMKGLMREEGERSAVMRSSTPSNPWEDQLSMLLLRFERSCHGFEGVDERIASLHPPFAHEALDALAHVVRFEQIFGHDPYPSCHIQN